MYISKVFIKNYRSIEEATYSFNDSKTVLVGKNNSGKTSLFDFMECAINRQSSFEYNDYPVFQREELCNRLLEYLNGKINFEELSNRIPKPQIDIQIEYGDEGSENELQAISPLIKDLDVSKQYAVVRVKGTLPSEDKVRSFLSRFSSTVLDSKKDETAKEGKDRNTPEANGSPLAPSKMERYLRSHFKELMTLRTYIVSMEDNSESLSNKGLGDYIFARFINAQRPIEIGSDRDSPLNRALQKYLSEGDSDANAQIEDLKQAISATQEDMKDKLDDKLSNLLRHFYHNVYPQSSGETSIEFDSSFDIESALLDNIGLVNGKGMKLLPYGKNGLGYKNLILIELMIAEFVLEAKNQAAGKPILFFIEEPEAHMHPQLQEKLVQFLDEHVGSFCKSIGVNKCPIVLTTHSPHIANVVDFSQLLYVLTRKGRTICKDLQSFATDDATKKFLSKYLTLTKCDLFFADKAILIEGASERILIPHFLSLLRAKGKLAKDNPLDHQHFTMLEVGGAYAHRFFPLLRFLEIPTLIITDIDAVNAKDNRKKCLVSEGDASSNATINEWWKDVKGNNKNPTLDQIRKMNDSDKTKDFFRIAFQTEEQGLTGRSLEEAIRNSNRVKYFVANTPPEESGLSNSEPKTEFALDIIARNEKDFEIPEYISEGLLWLEKQEVS